MAKEMTEAQVQSSYHVKNLTINGVPRRVIGNPRSRFSPFFATS